MNLPPTPTLLAIGLNPAWQKTLFFEQLHVGEVNRARDVRSQASGKGINFVFAAQQWGVAATVAQFAGGVIGDWLVADLEQRGLPHLTVRTAATTRVCNTVLCEASGTMTELIEPSGTITPAEVAQLRDAVLARIPAAAALALCGTFPPGVPESLYAEAAQTAHAHGVPVLLDGYRGVLPTLQTGVELLKINAAELAALTGQTALPQAARACFDRYPVRWLAVTAGPAQAALFSRDSACTFTLPRLEQVVNPIGAGDTTAGVLLAQLAACPETLTDATLMRQAFRHALAAASASCLTADPARYDHPRALELATRIQTHPATEPPR